MPAGAYRQQIYKMVEGAMKRELTPNEHKALSMVLKAYVKSHAPTEPIDQPERVHRFECVNCKKVEVGKGRNFYRGKRHRIVKDEAHTPNS